MYVLVLASVVSGMPIPFVSFSKFGNFFTLRIIDKGSGYFILGKDIYLISTKDEVDYMFF
jgi:hypothetical protein